MHVKPSTNPAEPVDKTRRVKLSDILIVVIFVAVITLLVETLFSQLRLRHEVAGARVTTDQLITAMQHQDAYSARKLGDASFQSQHNTSQLSYLFDQSKNFTKGTPTIAKQTVNNGSVNRVVSIYYQFHDQKPFYVRVTVVQPNHQTTWQVINFSGNASLNSLVK